MADKRRALWRRGQRKFALQAIIFFGHRKSRECSPKIRDFRANGIPVQERVDFFDTLILRHTAEGYFLCAEALAFKTGKVLYYLAGNYKPNYGRHKRHTAGRLAALI